MSPTAKTAALLACGLTSLVLGGCGGSDQVEASGARRQAVVILLDAARPDRMSCFGYSQETTPNIDALAADGTVFLEHYTQGMTTRFSLPCMLYSRYFVVPVFPFSANVPLARPEDLFRDLDDECISLPRLFSDQGFLTAGISAHIWIKENTRFAMEFDEFYDLSSTELTEKAYAYPRAEGVVDFTIDWLEQHRDDDFLLYVHLMDTHFPHFFGEEAREFLGTDPPALDRFDSRGHVKDIHRPLTDEERAYQDAIYDGSMRYVDRHLGRLFETLEELGVLESGMVAITSDHGEHLLETPGRYQHGEPPYEGVARIPLILLGRQRVPRSSVEFLTGMVDLMPTLAGCMGVEFPAGKSPDGLDLGPWLSGTPPDRDFMPMSNALRVGDMKAIFAGKREDRFRGDSPEENLANSRLFDVRRDPMESRDLSEEHPELLQGALRTYREQMGPLYRRFETSTTTETPRSPFALGAWSFQFDTELQKGTGDFRLEAGNSELVDCWLLNKRWPHFYLLGKGSPEPIRFRFDLPNGTYLVNLQLSGSCRLTIDGESEPRVVTGPTSLPRVASGAESVSIGEVRIDGGSFIATIETAEGGGSVFVRSIGFSPVGAGEVDLDAERERIEMLKTLGYVEEG